MEKLAKSIGFGFMFIAAIVVAAPFSAIMGYFAGWTVSCLYNDTILAFLAAIGIKGFTLSQVGASMGFLNSFLRTSVSVRKED